MVTQKLTKRVTSEIDRLTTDYGYSKTVLEDFALFILQKEPPPPKPLSLPKLKALIYRHFEVQDTTALKKSGLFQIATSGIGKINLSKKAGWEILYRKFIGILPGEEDEQGYGCINGVDIFKYDLPWQAFGLEPETSTIEEIKSAYRQLSKIYHPDIPNTGDKNIFEQLTVFYNSLNRRFE